MLAGENGWGAEGAKGGAAGSEGWGVLVGVSKQAAFINVSIRLLNGIILLLNGTKQLIAGPNQLINGH